MGINCERQSIFKYALVTHKESTVISKDYCTPFMEESGPKRKKFYRMSRKLEYVQYPQPLPRVPYSVCVTFRREKSYIVWYK